MLAHAAHFAKKRGVVQLGEAGRELGQVEVGAVGGGLHGARRHGQAGGAAAEVARVVGPAPAADVHPLAVVDQKRRGHQVGAVAAAAPVAKGDAERRQGQVGVELLNELRAAGRAGQPRGVGVGAQALAQHVHPARRVELQQLGQIEAAGAQVSGPLHRAPVGADAGHEAIGCSARRSGAVGPGRSGQVRRSSAAAHKHPPLAIALNGKRGVLPAAAQQAGPLHRAQVGTQFANQRIRRATLIGGPEAPGQPGEVERAGGRRHVHVAGPIQQHIAAEGVAVVRRHGRAGGYHAVVAAAAQEGAGQQAAAVGAQAREHQVGPVGHGIGRAGGAEGRHRRAAAKRALRRARGGGVVGRAGAAQQQQLVLPVRHQAVRKLGVGAAQVGGPHPRRRPARAGVVLDEGDVGQPVEEGLERARRGGVAQVEGNAARVHIARVVVGGREAPVVGRRAGEGRKLHRGVDGEGPAVVVGPQGEAQGVASQHVAAGHGPALSGGVELPGLRGQLGNGAHAGGDDEVAGRVEGQGIGAVVAQRYAGGVGARGQLHVVFQALGGVFVQRQVDAGPEAGVAQPAEGPHVAGPAAGVVAHEVVALARRGPGGREAGAGAGASQTPPRRRGPRWPRWPARSEPRRPRGGARPARPGRKTHR